MQRCIRHGLFSEALDLWDRGTTFLLDYNTISIAQDISTRLAQTKVALVTILVSKLKYRLGLEALLDTTNLLRRCNLEEAEIHRVFLMQRDALVDVELQGIKASQSDSEGTNTVYFQATRSIEYMEKALVETINEFQTVFGDEGMNERPCSELDVWLNRQVLALIDLIQGALSSVNDGTLTRSIIQAALQCASNLGAVGFDVQGTVPVSNGAHRHRRTDGCHHTSASSNRGAAYCKSGIRIEARTAVPNGISIG